MPNRIRIIGAVFALGALVAVARVATGPSPSVQAEDRQDQGGAANELRARGGPNADADEAGSSAPLATDGSGPPFAAAGDPGEATDAKGAVVTVAAVPSAAQDVAARVTGSAQDAAATTAGADSDWPAVLADFHSAVDARLEAAGSDRRSIIEIMGGLHPLLAEAAGRHGKTATQAAHATQHDARVNAGLKAAVERINKAAADAAEAARHTGGGVPDGVYEGDLAGSARPGSIKLTVVGTAVAGELRLGDDVAALLGNLNGPFAVLKDNGESFQVTVSTRFDFRRGLVDGTWVARVGKEPLNGTLAASRADGSSGAAAPATPPDPATQATAGSSQ